MRIFIKFAALTFTLYSCTTSNDQKNQQNTQLEPIIEIVNTPKILYRGIKNKVKIAIHNADSLTVNDKKNTITHHSSSFGNIYILDVTTTKEKNKELEITAFYKNNLQKKHLYSFEIRDIERPRVTINKNSASHIKMSIKEIKNAKIDVFIKDFIYNKYTNVFGFKVKMPGIHKDFIRVNGNTISDEIFDEIRKLKNGDEIVLFEVKYSLDKKIIGKANIRYKRLPPIRIEIVNEH